MSEEKILFEGVEISENEELTAETVEELSNGRGDES